MVATDEWANETGMGNTSITEGIRRLRSMFGILGISGTGYRAPKILKFVVKTGGATTFSSNDFPNGSSFTSRLASEIWNGGDWQ